MDGLREWFSKLSDLIISGKMWGAFWSHGKPVEEDIIEAQLRPQLSRYVRERGGTLHSLEDTGLGLSDYVCNYGGHEVVVEITRSCGDWKHGISVQLPSSLQGRKTSYGLFVVFAFEGKFCSGSTELAELLSCRDLVCEERKIRVDVIVVL